MKTFADWFVTQVNGQTDNKDILENVGTYYAAAFEIIAIGAAHL